MRHKKKLVNRLLRDVTVLAIGSMVGFTASAVSTTNDGQSDIQYKQVIQNEPVIKLKADIPKVIELFATAINEETVEPIENIEPAVIYYDCPIEHELQDYIRELCDKHGVPMSLVIAMIEVESSFRPNLISRTNDYGLMQINEVNHGWLSEKHGITDFLNPYQNVFCGISIIAEHLEKTNGDIALALMRYNCGATGARKLWDKGIYSTSYSDKVIAAMEVRENEIQ